MTKRYCTMAALALAAFAALPADAAQKYSQVMGFKEAKVNPACLAIGTAPHVPSAVTASVPDGSAHAGAQTLWIDNNCSAPVSFDKLTHQFADGAHDTNGAQVIFSFRQTDGTRSESAIYLLRHDANGNDCRTADFLVPGDTPEPRIAHCKSLRIAPQESVGFRPYLPLTVEWSGASGAFIKAETIQE